MPYLHLHGISSIGRFEGSGSVWVRGSDKRTPITVPNFDHGFCPNVHSDKPAWYKVTDAQLAVCNYKNVLQGHLHDVHIPVDVLVCHDSMCTNVAHSVTLNEYASSIMNAFMHILGTCLKP